MRITAPFNNPPAVERNFAKRLHGPDRGLISAWLAGIAMRGRPVQSAAEAGELPVLPFRGGVERAIKAKQKIGSLKYLAMWQGLRGEDLDIDCTQEPTLTCTRTGVEVLFTLDTQKLFGANNQE